METSWRTFRYAALADALKAKGQQLASYEHRHALGGQSPVGLHVEKSLKLHGADMRGGGSNFHMKPNGVFCIGDGAAGVTETRHLAVGAQWAGERAQARRAVKH